MQISQNFDYVQVMCAFQNPVPDPLPTTATQEVTRKSCCPLCPADLLFVRHISSLAQI